MAYRVIIRLSLNGNNAAGTAIRKKLNSVLRASTNVASVGRRGQRTATFEGGNMSQTDVAEAMRLFWDVMYQPANYFRTAPAGWFLDHVWTYVEEDPCP